MRKPGIFILFSVFSGLILFALDKNERQTITTGSLFQEMIDLVKLAAFPDPPFRMVQFSSSDRRSRIPGGPDWFANSDGFGGEPLPNFERLLKEPDETGEGEYLVADVGGPGAVVRLWTAAISGKVRMYIDGAESPLFDGPADEFFHRPYDHFPQMENINRGRFQATICQRDASYAPIPFAKHLRIVWRGKIEDIHFYHMQVRLYSPGTPLLSFSPEDITKYSEIIDRVSLVLSDPDTHFRSQSKQPEISFSATIGPSEKKEVLILQRSGAVERLVLRLRADDMDKALRQTVLHIFFDGHSRGQVQSPVGDFFGAAPGVNPYQSLPFIVRPDGTMVCRFVMPFESSLKILLDNRGEQKITAEGSILPLHFTWDENSLHFRALWRVDHNITASNLDVQDLPFLLALGRGVYVGTASFLLNPNPIPTPWGNWWGEGDEKVFVDDDAFPSLFGTGSEDYYNYSWSSPDIFFFPYCGQPRNDGPGNRGFVTNFRWHILDPLPFAKNIRFYMELFSHERTPGLSYARIGYHYAKPGTTDDHRAIMPDDLRAPRLPKGWIPAARFGARNSVFYPAEDILSPNPNTRLQEGDLWAGGKLLVWTPKAVGDRINFTVNIDSPGKKRIHLAAALTPQSGKFGVLLDNKPVLRDSGEETIDLYQPHRTLLRDFLFQDIELEPGKHTFSLEYKGVTEQVELPEIGIDFVWVQTVEQ